MAIFPQLKDHHTGKTKRCYLPKEIVNKVDRAGIIKMN